MKGRGELLHNLQTDRPAFVDRSKFDYRLTGRSPAIDAGGDPGTADGFSLIPVAEYLHRAAEKDRTVVGRIDVGAYEYVPGR